MWFCQSCWTDCLDEENAIRTEQQCEVLQQIQEQLGILPMSDPYDYVNDYNLNSMIVGLNLVMSITMC